MDHDENCPRKGKWYVKKECREFSTDGTAMGAFTAHTMGTDDPEEIKRIGMEDLRNMATRGLTGMEEEQADWESVDPDLLERIIDEEEVDYHPEELDIHGDW